MFLISGMAYAAGTTRTTDITAKVASLDATYTGDATNDFDKGSETNEVTAVTGVYGIRFKSVSPADYEENGGIGSLLTITYTVTNWGNDVDDIDYSTANESLEQASGDGSTSAAWLTNTTLDKTQDASVAEDGDGVVAVSVTVPPNAVNNTTWNIEIVCSANGNPIVTQYTGFNSGDYGGDGQVTSNLMFVVAGTPYILLIDRTVEIDTTGMTDYTGTADQPVPGAKLKYTIVLENNSTSGDAGAVDITLTDYTPDDTTYFAGEDSYTSDGDSTFTAPAISNGATGAVTWTQDGGALDLGERVTFNYTVIID